MDVAIAGSWIPFSVIEKNGAVRIDENRFVFARFNNGTVEILLSRVLKKGPR
jgi:hypothetical protein